MVLLLKCSYFCLYKHNLLFKIGSNICKFALIYDLAFFSPLVILFRIKLPTYIYNSGNRIGIGSTVQEFDIFFIKGKIFI